jgi:hypothetical protein
MTYTDSTAFSTRRPTLRNNYSPKHILSIDLTSHPPFDSLVIEDASNPRNNISLLYL